MSDENQIKEPGWLTAKQFFIKVLICSLFSFAYYIFLYENVLRYHYNYELGIQPDWTNYNYIVGGYPLFVVFIFTVLFRKINLHWIKIVLIAIQFAFIYLFVAYCFFIIFSLNEEKWSNSTFLKKHVVGGKNLSDWLFQIEYTNLGIQMTSTDLGNYIFTFISLLISAVFMWLVYIFWLTLKRWVRSQTWFSGVS